jgi:hypothetical protein
VRALLLLDCTSEAIAEAIALDIHDAKQLVHQLQQLGTAEATLRALWMDIAKVVIGHEADMAVPIALIQESGGILSIDVSVCCVLATVSMSRCACGAATFAKDALHSVNSRCA